MSTRPPLSDAALHAAIASARGRGPTVRHSGRPRRAPSVYVVQLERFVYRPGCRPARRIAAAAPRTSAVFALVSDDHGWVRLTSTSIQTAFARSPDRRSTPTASAACAQPTL